MEKGYLNVFTTLKPKTNTKKNEERVRENICIVIPLIQIFFVCSYCAAIAYCIRIA